MLQYSSACYIRAMYVALKTEKRKCRGLEFGSPYYSVKLITNNQLQCITENFSLHLSIETMVVFSLLTRITYVIVSECKLRLPVYVKSAVYNAEQLCTCTSRAALHFHEQSSYAVCMCWAGLHCTNSKFKYVKSSMARSLPVENLLPQNVGSLINYLQ